MNSSRSSSPIRRPLSRDLVSPRRRASASTSSRNADMNSVSPPPNPSDRAGAGTSPRAPARSATCATIRRSNGASGPPGVSAGTTHRAGPPGPAGPQAPWRPWSRRRPGGRAHLEPAPRGQVDQGRAEPELVQPPGQQADHGRRHIARPGAPPCPSRCRSCPRPGHPPRAARARAERSAGRRAGTATPRGDGGHRKHDIPLRPVSTPEPRPPSPCRPGAVPPPYLTRLPAPTGSGAKIDKR